MGFFKLVILTSQGYISEVVTVSKHPQRNSWAFEGQASSLAGLDQAELTIFSDQGYIREVVDVRQGSQRISSTI